MSVRVTRPETNIAQKLSLIDDKISFEQLKTILAGPGGHLTVGNIKEWGPTSSACPLNVRLEQTSTYNNQVPSVHNSVLTLQNKYDSDTGNIAGTHSTIQFGVNGGQNSLGSISLVSEATETDSFPAGFTFCTQRSSGSRPEAMRITGSGNVGIGTTGPIAKLDIQRNNDPGRELRIGRDILTHYDFTDHEYRGKDLEVRLTGGSYHQSEVIVTCHRTNTGSNGNNLYIRGIWHNNYTNHFFEEIDRVGHVDGATITFQATDASFGTADSSAGLKINLISTTEAIQGLYIRVTDFRNAHGLDELITS